MKVNLDTEILDIWDKPIPVQGKEGFLTLKDVCINAILLEGQDEIMEGKEKVRRYQLALKIKEGGVQNLSVEDLSLLKEKVGRMYTVLVAGQALPLLDGEEIKN